MNLIMPSRSPKTNTRRLEAFTLVELLVVIAIMTLLAGLVVGMAPAAITKMRRARVEAERDALITVIGSYQRVKGFYPPGNTNSTYQTPLFYELTGTIMTNGNFLSIMHETITPAMVAADFNIPGFINSSGDSTEVKNYFGGALKAAQHTDAVASPGSGNYTVLGIPVPGPVQVGATGYSLINPWHYVSANPTNNPDSYDLWMDVIWAGKTNRVSNWSKDPQPL